MQPVSNRHRTAHLRIAITREPMIYAIVPNVQRNTQDNFPNDELLKKLRAILLLSDATTLSVQRLLVTILTQKQNLMA